MPQRDDALEHLLVSLSSLVVDRQSATDTLDHIASLACDGIEPADYAAVTTLREGRPETTVATDPIIAVIDQAQYDVDSGPCLDSFRSGQKRSIEDTEDEARWPEFAAAAASHGVRSTLSLPLMAHDQGIGALNLYSRRPRSFSPADHDQATKFAGAAAVLLANTQLFWEARRLADNLQAALASRSIIEQAKGILMAQRGVDADTAFDLLRTASQRENVKLRDIARRVVEQTTSHRPERS